MAQEIARAWFRRVSADIPVKNTVSIHAQQLSCLNSLLESTVLSSQKAFDLRSDRSLLAHFLAPSSYAFLSKLASDGSDSAFAPPSPPFSGRMWVGGRISFHRPPPKNQSFIETTNISNAEFKQNLGVFVTTKRTYSVESDVTNLTTITDTRTHLFRVNQQSNNEYNLNKKDKAVAKTLLKYVAPPSTVPDVTTSHSTTPIILFQYSALTGNAHRIHYDQEYCRAEGYPATLVHGPLTATLMINVACRGYQNLDPAEFEYRAVSPLPVNMPFEVNVKYDNSGANVWVVRGGKERGLVMTGRVSCN